MTFKLIIAPEAEADLAEAFQWYESQRSGLGDEFLRAAEARLAEVQRRPESFARAYADLYRAMVRRFPYSIFFVVDGLNVNVLAVLHAKRNPRIWKRRRRR
jgi:plasmid stabilization system protein ParE